ncbi:MAG TPA: hypothetical protein ENN21_05240, partial [Spirochaetes bacterium]|nr:hypothetical protein [Spirochaetota bacterium]
MPVPEFKDPLYLLLLAPLAGAAFLYFRVFFSRHDRSLAVSSSRIVERRVSFRTRTYRYLPLLRVLSAALLI